MKIYNTMSRSVEEFVAQRPGEVSLYTCGPTVYHFAHIGNLRAFLFYDTLKRVLLQNGYRVTHVMNITDVGHLVASHDIDDTGEDKMEKGARREGKTAWEVAKYYTEAYLSDSLALNILPPTFQPKATEYISQQIELIKTLELKGYTYRTESGIAYDSARFAGYNKLSRLNLDELQEGARVEADPDKKNLTDFYLWKFSKPEEQRQMEWDSPWGKGFPGWHVECSAMAFALLGETIDIHCGGIDHIPVHHTNEIAQSEAASGKVFAHYWMHNNFLTLAGGVKMAKSGNNFYRMQSIIDLGFEPLVYRYMTLTAHYRSELEFSVESLQQAKVTLHSLRSFLRDKDVAPVQIDVSGNTHYLDFMEALNNDLNTPEALAVLHLMLKSSLSDGEKVALLLVFDDVLGLRLADEIGKSNYIDPQSITDLISGMTLSEIVELRQQARTEKNWTEADRLRSLAESSGYLIEDGPTGQKVRSAS